MHSQNSFIVHPSKSSLKVSHSDSSRKLSTWYRVAWVIKDLLWSSVGVSCALVEVDGIRGLPVGLFICSILFELVGLLWVIGVRFGVRFFRFFSEFSFGGKRGKG